jgi:GAF domain-containing protein
VLDSLIGLGRDLTTQEILTHVLEFCLDLTDCTGGFIELWEPSKDRLVIRAASKDYQQWVDRFSLAMGEGLAGWSALTGKTVLLTSNVKEDPRFFYVPEMGDDGWDSYLTLPLISPSRRVIGVIVLPGVPLHKFGESDQVLLATVATFISGAIENAQLGEEKARQTQVLRALVAGSRVLETDPSHNRALYRLAATAGRLLEADDCLLLAANETGTRLTVQSAWARTAQPVRTKPILVESSTIFSRLLGSTEAVVLGIRTRPDAAQLGRDLLGRPIRTAVVAPMRVGGECVGILACLHEAARTPSEIEQDFLSVIATHAAALLQNSRLKTPSTRRAAISGFFDALTLGRESEIELVLRAGRLGADLRAPHLVVACDAAGHRAAGGEASDDRVWRQLGDHLVEAFPGALINDSDDALYALVPLGKTASTRTVAETLTRIVTRQRWSSGYPISVGVSRACLVVSDYPAAFEQAHELLALSRAVHESGVVATADEFATYLQLSSIARRGFRDPLQDKLQELLDYDRRHSSQFFHTLQVYLESVGHSQTAADRLFVHRNTLRQRLARIRELTGIDIADHDNCFRLTMALRIMKLRQAPYQI